MMRCRSNRGYAHFNRGLLCYLLGLYLIGFSWHLHNHLRSDTVYQECLSEPSEGILSSSDACFLCDWLARYSCTGAEPLSAEQLLFSTGILHCSIAQDTPVFRVGQPGDSRAPPVMDSSANLLRLFC